MKGSVSAIQLLGRCLRRDSQLLQPELTRQRKQRSLILNNELHLEIQKPVMRKQKPFKGIYELLRRINEPLLRTIEPHCGPDNSARLRDQ